jgi:hypothetical protein
MMYGMNRRLLREIARAEGVPDGRYVVQGDEENWADGFDGFARFKARSDAILALKIVPGGWAVCTYERGEAFGEMRFDTKTKHAKSCCVDSFGAGETATASGAKLHARAPWAAYPRPVTPRVQASGRALIR